MTRTTAGFTRNQMLVRIADRNSNCGRERIPIRPKDRSITPAKLPAVWRRVPMPLLAAAHVIRCGQIVAVKGIGGFHLLVDARSDAAVRRLRDRKQREEKPFALLFPTWRA
jgi:hydrogenase maturation factor HypF (carbamoyltransferase family)